MDSHLQSNMREHLDLACVKLNSTQVQLNEQRVQLDEARVQLDETRVQLDETRVQLDETRVQLVETQAKLSCLTVEDGRKNCFIWKIKPFSECFRQAKEGVKEMIESDPFYTGRYGYKLKVFAYPYYTGYFSDFLPHAPQLSIGIVLMEGEYDNILTWPFSKKITFTIIDQNKDLKERKNHIAYLSPREQRKLGLVFVHDLFSERPGEKMMTVEGEIPCFISQETLQTRPFIGNDTLFIQVDIEPDD